MSEGLVIRLTMPNGETWEIPALFVAESRAGYYAGHDTGKKEGVEFDKVFKKELDIAMNGSDDDYYDILDWLSNNMDWKNIKNKARKVKDAVEYSDKDFQEAIVNGKKRVMTIE